MDIWNLDKLVLFIAFVVPGFVSLKCYEILCSKPQRDASNQLVDAIAYSCVNYAILFYFIYLVENSSLNLDSPRLYFAFYAFVLLIAPILWALLLKLARTTEYLQNFLPHPTGKPWDFVFAKRQEYWVIVTMKNGRRYGGFYGDDSFSSNAPYPEQIYLEQCWIISKQEGFARVKDNTAGILIVCKEIEAIQFFNVNYPREHP